LKKKVKKKGLYITGILMLFINISTTWFVKRIVMNGVRNNYPPLSNLKNQETIKASIFTINSDEIINVWNVGRKVKRIKETSQLPKDFLLLEEAKKEMIKKVIGPEYKIKKYKTYYKYQDENKLIQLYKIKKI
jgi:hypothetical protein